MSHKYTRILAARPTYVLYILPVRQHAYPWYGMVWYGAPPTPWTAIVATRRWQLDRAPAEHAQTESVPSALVRRWVSFPQGQASAVAELRACAISRGRARRISDIRLVVSEGPRDLSGEGRTRERAQEKSKPPPSQWGEKGTERSLGKRCRRDTGDYHPLGHSSRHFAPGNFHISGHDGGSLYSNMGIWGYGDM
jgi:hypothetical protein